MPPFKKWIDQNVTLAQGVKRSDDLLSSASHAVGFILAAAAAVFMVFRSAGSSRALIASLIYGVSMCTVFGASAVYHGLRESTWKRILRLVDHSSIYILIAGTYTPYAAAMGSLSGRYMMIAAWSLCVIGLVLNFVFWDRFKPLHLAVYLLMGWLVVFFWRPLHSSFPTELIRWMVIGGAFYTTGVYFYISKKIPHSHFIWHLFVIGGAAGLYMGIIQYAIPLI
ncbi:MAG: hemolysin III family protein [Spirochaetaceae bacterium]|nr:hemolysin III family protein [Spirochaetaceae bacterium]